MSNPNSLPAALICRFPLVFPLYTPANAISAASVEIAAFGRLTAVEQDEFNKKRLRTEDSGHIYLDLRPFGPREDKAVLFCLQETLFAVGNKMKAGKVKIEQKIVVICEPTTKLPRLVKSLVREINKQGQPLEIRPEHRETSE